MKQIARMTIPLALLLAWPLSCAAEDLPRGVGMPPDTGRVLHELEPGRQITPGAARPKIDTKVPESAQAEGNLRARISHVVYDCAELDVAAELGDALAAELGHEMDFPAMQALAQEVTQRLRQQGYLTAIAYVPAQTIEAETLRIRVIIGRYGDIRIENTSSLRDASLLRFMQALQPGRLIRTQPLERSLLVLNDLPGLRAEARMEPGRRQGTASLLLRVEDVERQGGYLTADNYGSRYTGRNRVGLGYRYDNVTRRGDQVDLVCLGSTEDMRSYQLRYSLPVGGRGASVHITGSHMNYALGDLYEPYHIDGQSNTYELGYSVPLARTYGRSTFFSFVGRVRSIHDGVEYGSLMKAKRAVSGEADLYGYVRTPRYAVSYTAGQVAGRLHYERDYGMPGPHGFYQKTVATASYIANLAPRWQLHGNLSGQYAWQNLDSSEQFFIGGPDSVRAFPQGETGGDHGLLGSLELRYATGAPHLTATAFVDAGRVWHRRHQTAADFGTNVRNLAGAGVGLIYQRARDWYGELSWAVPFGSHRAESLGEEISSMTWLHIVKEF